MPCPALPCPALPCPALPCPSPPGHDRPLTNAAATVPVPNQSQAFPGFPSCLHIWTCITLNPRPKLTGHATTRHGTNRRLVSPILARSPPIPEKYLSHSLTHSLPFFNNS